jgi:hypothetical protein
VFVESNNDADEIIGRVILFVRVYKDWAGLGWGTWFCRALRERHQKEKQESWVFFIRVQRTTPSKIS